MSLKHIIRYKLNFKQQDTNIGYILEIIFKPEDIDILKVKGWKNTQHGNKNIMKGRVAILV